MKIGDGTGWSFSGEKWTENKKGDKPDAKGEIHDAAFFEEGTITPPDKRNLQSRAFYHMRGFANGTIEFDFDANYRENGSGDAGLILRATGPNNYYFVHFPWNGQAARAKHFWASVSKVQGDGYIRSLKTVWVPGVPSEIDRWYRVRVQAEGPQISVWVDGRRALTVTDNTYRSGVLGLAGYGMYYFRNIRVRGDAVKAPQGRKGVTIPSHSFPLALNSKSMPAGCIAPNGDVLLSGQGYKAGSILIRSKDKGRTWEKPVPISIELPGSGQHGLSDYGSAMYKTAAGRLMVMVTVQGSPPRVGLSESHDNGYTWSAPVESQIGKGWKDLPKMYPYGPVTETADGTLLRFFYCDSDTSPVKFESIMTWGAAHFKAYAMRSADGGRNWSEPIELDRPQTQGQERGTIPGTLDLTEPTGIAIGNTVTVLVRPVASPTMWQCWSNDGGLTWDAATRTTFPGYAQAMVRTKNGAILCAHRFPGYAVNISYDDGLNWDAGTIIDYPNWAMGNLIEVEPNVVLATYMNADYGDSPRLEREPLLAQLIRVTKNGLQPVDVRAKK